ncbi:hypothetical protein U1Q18_038844, partial [Sarracenia purpurea var. burkii]
SSPTSDQGFTTRPSSSPQPLCRSTEKAVRLLLPCNPLPRDRNEPVFGMVPDPIHRGQVKTVDGGSRRSGYLVGAVGDSVHEFRNGQEDRGLTERELVSREPISDSRIMDTGRYFSSGRYFSPAALSFPARRLPASQSTCGSASINVLPRTLQGVSVLIRVFNNFQALAH